MSGNSGKLLLIEDDPFLIEWVEWLIKDNFPDMGLELMKIHSEREFLVKRDLIARQGVRGIVLDIMLPWEDGVAPDSTDFTEPRGEWLDAGIRIIGDIMAIPGLAAIPVVIHTVNDLNTLNLPDKNPQITFIRKDESDSQLIEWIRKLPQERVPSRDSL